MSMDDERISITTEKLDGLLKAWKRKGAGRSMAHIVGLSLVLAFVCGLFPRLNSIDVIAPIYCAVAFFVAVTADS